MVVLARLVSRELFGQYQLLLSVFMVMSITSLSGFNGSLMRALARSYDGTLKAVTVLSWRWSLLGVVILLVVGWYWQSAISVGVGRALMVSAVVMSLFHVTRRWQVVLHAKEEFRRRALYNVAASLLMLSTVSAVAVVARDNIMMIFLAYIVVLAVLHSFFFDRASRLLENNRVEKGWKSSGYKLLMSEVFTVAYAHLDKLVLALWLGVEGLAVYAVAIVFGEATKYFFANFVAVFLPTIHRAGAIALWSWLRDKWVSLLLIMVGVVLVLWVVVPAVLVGVFSDKYIDSVPYAQVYLLIVPGHLLASLFGYGLIREKKEWEYMTAMVLAGIVNVGLYVVLIPIIGIYGAVVGSIAYYAVMAAALWYVAWRFVQSQTRQHG
jgi:O-antigen/teichoic acid export membrane protein